MYCTALHYTVLHYTTLCTVLDFYDHINVCQEEGGDMSSQLTSKSWFDLWQYLRKSPTLGVLRQRLDKLLIIYPSKSAASYIALLWSIAATWTICCFNWELILGYRATTLQQGIHSSMKSRLHRQRIPVHEVVLFFREVMFFNMECNSNRVAPRRLYLEAENSGLKAFSAYIAH